MIKKIGNRFCLFTKDGTRKLGCHDTRAEAEAQERLITDKTQKQYASVRALAGKLRSERLDGRDYYVVPVTALVEGVIQASNSEVPELVLAEELSKNPEDWNGKPITWHHPILNGEAVSAESDVVRDRMAFGVIKNARVEGDSLRMDAFLDKERVQKIPQAMAVVKRLEQDERVDVSVGALVEAELVSGEYDGQHYDAVWHDLEPDHLAMLPDGVDGACSLAMGCGAQRAAAAGRSGMKTKWLAKVSEFVSKLRSADAPEVSDYDLRELLEHTLYQSVPAFAGVTDVFSDASEVVYATMAEDGAHTFRQKYAVDNGAVTLDGDPYEVQRVTKYEPLAAPTVTEKNGRYCHMTPDGKEMCHDTQAEAEAMVSKMKMMKAASAGCGCGGDKNKAPTQNTEAIMEKKDRVKAIIASKKTCFLESATEALMALPEDQLKALEDHVAKPAEEPKVVEKVVEKELTPEQMLAKMPDVLDIVTEHKAAAARRKAEIVQLVTASSHKDVYTKEELEAMTVKDLEKVAKLIGAAKPAVDQSGRGLPRTAAEGEDNAPPKPIDMRERILASRKQSA